MILGLSISKNAKNIEVSVKTSFYIRHKILDCIRKLIGISDVDGIVEMDETFSQYHINGIIKKVGLKCQHLLVKEVKNLKYVGLVMIRFV